MRTWGNPKGMSGTPHSSHQPLTVLLVTALAGGQQTVCRKAFDWDKLPELWVCWGSDQAWRLSLTRDLDLLCPTGQWLTTCGYRTSRQDKHRLRGAAMRTYTLDFKDTPQKGGQNSSLIISNPLHIEIIPWLFLHSVKLFKIFISPVSFYFLNNNIKLFKLCVWCTIYVYITQMEPVLSKYGQEESGEHLRVFHF